MSYAIKRSELAGSHNASAEPPTSAQVLDFICLFSHDLRRKQKRWQDGRLKYHTFNKRVMVYDDRAHFIGDAHWQGDGDLESGETIELDRGGAIVEVQECVGSKEQDLSELLDKRAREVEKRREMAAAKTPARTQASGAGRLSSSVGARTVAGIGNDAAPSRGEGRTNPHMTHRSLNTMLPSPGPIGRANIPDRSPFEARQTIKQQHREFERGEVNYTSSKRRKLDDDDSPEMRKGHAQALFGTKLTLSATPLSTPWMRGQPLKETTNVQPMKETTNVQPLSTPEPKSSRVVELPLVSSDDSTVISAQETRVHDTNYTREPQKSQLQDVVRDTRRDPQHPDDQPSARDESSTKPPAEAQIQKTAPLQKRKSHLNKTQTLQQPTKPVALPGHITREVTDLSLSNEEPRKVVELVLEVQSKESHLNHKLEEDGTNQGTASNLRSSSLSSTAKDITSGHDAAPSLFSRKEGEVRTELRIRSRKRRGLLMMTEKESVTDQRNMPTGAVGQKGTSKSNIDQDALVKVRCHSLRLQKGTNDLASGASIGHGTADRGPPIKQRTPGSPSHIDADNPQLPTIPQPDMHLNEKEKSDPDHDIQTREKLPRKRSRVPVSKSIVDVDVTDVATKDTPKPRYRRSLRSVSTESESDHERQEMVTRARPTKPEKENQKQPKTKIQVRRVGSKSTKSKEIFGWVPPNNGLNMPAAYKAADGLFGGKENCTETAAAPLTERAEATIQPDRIDGENEFIHQVGDREKRQGEILLEDFPRCGDLSDAEIPSELPGNGTSTVAISSPPKDQRARRGSEYVSEIRKIESNSPQVRSVKPAEKLEPITAARAGVDGARGVNNAGNSEHKIIHNPASRGRKAALACHAAGQLVEASVPFEPTRPFKPQAKALGKAKDNALPGFSKANGGAWSAHAEDLLGMTRPTRQ